MGLFDFFKSEKRSSNFLSSATLYGTNSGIRVSEKSSLGLTAVWAAVRLLSETIASLPLNVYKIDKDGSKDIDYNNPLNMLISISPNPNYTTYNFLETMMNHLLLWGNAYAKITRNGGARPIKIDIINPENVEPFKSDDDGLIYYNVKDQGILSDREILHIVGFSFDGIIGKSPIRVASEALGIAQASQQFGANIYGKGANLSGVLENPSRLSDEAANRLRESFSTRFSGINYSHQTAVLEEGVKFKPIGMPLADAQFIETRRFSTEEIARLFKVPNHLINDLTKSSFNNIEQQSLEFVKYSLLPYIRNWEGELNRKLLANRELSTHYFKFQTKELLRGDADSRAEYYSKLQSLGALSANDIRSMENMNKIEGGDKYYVPLNLGEVGKINNDNENQNGS